MPMQRNLYPPDWEDISLRLKIAAEWRCQRCGIQRGEQQRNQHGDLVEAIITTAHLDHDPWNPNARLEVMCAPCHRAYDNADRPRRVIMMQIARGQHPLPGMEAFYPTPSRQARTRYMRRVVTPRIRPTRARPRKAAIA